MNLQEIEQKFLTVNAEKERDEETITTLRSQRASLFLEDSSGYSQEIDSLDKEIVKLQSSIDNFPSVIEELEHLLTAEQKKLAQEAKASLLTKQGEAAEEVQVLSKSFVGILEKAVNINESLRAALTAEAELAQNSGQHFPTERCRGSLQSLNMLLEIMQSQLFQGGSMTLNEETGKNINIIL